MTDSNGKNGSGDNYAIETRNLNIYYGSFKAIADVSLQIQRQKIRLSSGRRGVARAHCCVLSTA
jgi:ABC-type phosphate transport system ATPase subunit